MKIWFDFANSPHINMFAAMVRDLRRQNEVLITCRPLANTIDLLELHGFDYTVVGTHCGRRLSAKLMGYPVRVLQLRHYLHDKGIDVSISQQSFHSPPAALLLGVRSIYLTDNEHATANIPAFLCADTIVVPECLDGAKLQHQGANLDKVVRYPGVKEGIYLWELEQRLAVKRVPSNPRKQRPSIYVRSEPWMAHYYKGRRAFIDDLLIGLGEEADVTLLLRGKEQGPRYQDPRFEHIRVVTAALDLAEIVPDCDLFVGAGGTMTREMAVMGVPTISVYEGDLLDVDRHLLEVGAFVHRPGVDAQEALSYMASASRHTPNTDLLDKGHRAYDLIKRTILEVGSEHASHLRPAA
jgi:predicted glycosyltransferase